MKNGRKLKDEKRYTLKRQKEVRGAMDKRNIQEEIWEYSQAWRIEWDKPSESCKQVYFINFII